MAQESPGSRGGAGGKSRPSWLSQQFRAHQFQKGQSGNPSGRSPGLVKLVKRQTKNGRELIDFYLRVLRGEPLEITRVIPRSDDQPPVTLTWRQSPDVRSRLEAARELRDTGWGKPAQAVEIKEDGAPRRVATLVFLDGGDSDPLAEPEPKSAPRPALPPPALAEVPFEMDDTDHS